MGNGCPFHNYIGGLKDISSDLHKEKPRKNNDTDPRVIFYKSLSEFYTKICGECFWKELESIHNANSRKGSSILEIVSLAGGQLLCKYFLSEQKLNYELNQTPGIIQSLLALQGNEKHTTPLDITLDGWRHGLIFIDNIFNKLAKNCRSLDEYDACITEIKKLALGVSQLDIYNEGHILRLIGQTIGDESSGFLSELHMQDMDFPSTDFLRPMKEMEKIGCPAKLLIPKLIDFLVPLYRSEFEEKLDSSPRIKTMMGRIKLQLQKICSPSSQPPSVTSKI